MTTKNSTLVANFEASPKVMNDAANLQGVVRIAQDTIVWRRVTALITT